MKTRIVIEIDTSKNECTITETNAETVTYAIVTDSDKCTAASCAEALQDYMEGLG